MSVLCCAVFSLQCAFFFKSSAIAVSFNGLKKILPKDFWILRCSLLNEFSFWFIWQFSVLIRAEEASRKISCFMLIEHKLSELNHLVVDVFEWRRQKVGNFADCWTFFSAVFVLFGWLMHLPSRYLSSRHRSNRLDAKHQVVSACTVHMQLFWAMQFTLWNMLNRITKVTPVELSAIFYEVNFTRLVE